MFLACCNTPSRLHVSLTAFFQLLGVGYGSPVRPYGKLTSLYWSLLSAELSIPEFVFLLHPVAAVQGWKHPLCLFLCPFQAQLSTENGSPDPTCGFISDISICHCPNKALYSLFWVQKGSCHILNSSRSHGLSTFLPGAQVNCKFL